MNPTLLLLLALAALLPAAWLLSMRIAYRTGVRDGAERATEAMLDLEDETETAVEGLRASWRREREATGGRPN